MAADVFMASLRARSDAENRITKVNTLFQRAGFGDFLQKGDLTAVKIHFGERGNDSFIPPHLVRPVIDKIKACGGRPFLTDTRTLYSGGRSNAVDHVETAIAHGFAYAVAGAPVIIADGLRGDDATDVPVAGRHFSRVRIAGGITAADAMVVLSHFKAHMLSGFGGAVKNLAMGCAPPAGKREMHAAHAQVIEQRCAGCGECATVCPAGAIRHEDERAVITRDTCIGCGECMTVCPGGAIEFDWEVELPPFMEKMAEYALGAVQGKREKTGYFNFLTAITPDCDCVPWSDAPIVPDIGILASRDPVAIDAASCDLVNAQEGLKQSLLARHHASGGDKFRGTWEFTDGMHLLRYAEEIGLGSAEYRLIGI
jgi:uncharacterized Fe-S center protein